LGRRRHYSSDGGGGGGGAGAGARSLAHCLTRWLAGGPAGNTTTANVTAARNG